MSLGFSFSDLVPKTLAFSLTDPQKFMDFVSWSSNEFGEK
jgi:hypothetical protein